MIDALGTKGRWKYESPDSFLFFMSTIRKALRENTSKIYDDELEKYGFPKPDMYFLSDTLIITQSVETRDEKDTSLILHRLTKHLSGLIASSFIFTIYFRGVVSFGDYLRDEYCLIGPAVDDAASVYELPQQIGVVLHENVNKTVSDFLDLYNMLMNHFIINYQTPFKQKNEYFNKEYYNINWPKMLRFMNEDEKIDSRKFLINQFSKTPTPDENAKRKLDNSLSFFDYAASNKNKLSSINEYL